MQTLPPQQSGFFSNLLSVGIFALIMLGLFFGFTRLYPDMIKDLRGPSITGIPRDQTLGSDLAPFIRGVLSGVQSSQVSSVRERSGPLDINRISGYYKGITASIISSKNWYDIDRQLFRVRGIDLGVSTALATSSSVKERGTLSYQVKLIEQIQIALETNLDTFLIGNKTNRERLLTEYLGTLRKLSNEASIEVENMTRTTEEAMSEFNQNVEVSKSLSEEFVSDTSAFNANNIDNNLSQFQDARRKAQDAKARFDYTAEILNRLRPFAEQIPVYIEAIEANYDALVSGIKVTPRKGVNLPIFQEQ